MKVILLKDVAKIGKRFSVVEVPNGFALNQLIPKKMAELANAKNIKQIERRQASSAAVKEVESVKFESAKSALTSTMIKIAADTNEKGHLFKAIHESDIVAAAKESGVEIDVSMLKINSPIKEVGEHVVILMQSDKTAEITIEVIKK